MNFLDFLNNIGYPIKLLNEVINNKHKYVYTFKFKGKWQIAPKWQLKILQKILKDYLTKNYSENKNISNNATAYIKNKNISYNLERHQGNSYFFTSDFKNFFPSIYENDIKNILSTTLVNESTESLTYINKIIYHKGRLQYGFPTSPIISNLIMYDFDKELDKILNEKYKNINIQYTRYSDDITISSKYKIDKLIIKNTIIELMELSYSFLKLNNKKTRYFEKYAHRPHITGLIPLSNRNTIGKKRYNEIKLNINLLINNEVITNNKYFQTINSLSSYLNYMYLVDRHNYIRLKNSFNNKYKSFNNYELLFKK
jgi:RNA-directed DNA polymerase